MMYIFDFFRSKRKIINERDDCRLQRKADEKAYQATILNLETANDTLVEDMTVLSNKKLRESNDTQLVYPYPTPIRAVKDYTWVQNCLNNYRVTPKLSFLPMDRNKNLSTKEDIEKFLAWDLTSDNAYLSDNPDGNKIFVCNHFAASLWGRYPTLTNWNNIGFVLDFAGHAYNIAITADGRVYMIEPQSDRLWEFNSDKAKGIYDAEDGFVSL